MAILGRPRRKGEKRIYDIFDGGGKWEVLRRAVSFKENQRQRPKFGTTYVHQPTNRNAA